MEDFTLRLKLTEEENREMKTYTSYLPTEMILFGLRFAFNRYKALSGGYLLPGRKSIVKRETRMLSRAQAQWRLKNWKSMIRSYKQRGYSYPTISRIKKQVRIYASKGSTTS